MLGARIGALESGFHAHQHRHATGLRERAEGEGVFDGLIVFQVGSLDLFFLFVHFLAVQVGLDVQETTLAPFGVDHFDDEIHFDLVDGLELLNVGFEEEGVLVVVFIWVRLRCGR